MFFMFICFSAVLAGIYLFIKFKKKYYLFLSLLFFIQILKIDYVYVIINYIPKHLLTVSEVIVFILATISIRNKK